MGDGFALAAGAGDGCGSGVGLESSGIVEAGPVVSGLGEHPGAGERAEPWEAGDDPGVRVLVKRLHGGGFEAGGAGAGGVQLAQQGECLLAHGPLDERGLAHLLRAEGLAQPGGFGVDAAAAACFLQQGAQLGQGQFRCGGRGGGGGQDGAGPGAHDAVAGAGEGGEEAGEVLAQVGAELVVRGGAVPDGVLLGAGQYRDGPGELAVGGQRPVRVHVGAQHAGQDERVALVGFPAGDRVPVPVAGHRHRVDGIDLAAGGAQAGHEQPAGGLDRHRDGVIGGVAVGGEQFQQPGQAGRVVADPQPGQQPAVAVHVGDVVVVFGPVDSAEYVQLTPPYSVLSCRSCWSRPCRARMLPNGRARGHRHPIGRS
jgi:hypothetical protein